jgi:hypothetical protein
MIDTYFVTPGFRIISGGQNGADTAALDWAMARGIEHGGWCPKGRKSESGPIDARYCLSETPTASYLQRTEWNVRDSDATLIFTPDDQLDGGSKRTAEFADRHGKPWLHFRLGIHPKFIARFLSRHKVRVLNVAGKRASTAPGVYALVTDSLSAALSTAPDAHSEPDADLASAA